MLCNRIRSTTNADIIHDAIRFVAERQKKERLKLITSDKEDESYNSSNEFIISMIVGA